MLSPASTAKHVPIAALMATIRIRFPVMTLTSLVMGIVASLGGT
jgi:hypothetical protein